MPDVNEQLLAAGLKRVVQCARGTERDPFGGPLRTTWLDTEWDSIEDAQFHHPEYIYRNVIIGGEDEQFEEEKTEGSAIGSAVQEPVFKFTRKDITDMSTVEYKTNLLTVPGFARQVNALFKDIVDPTDADIAYSDIASEYNQGIENAERLNVACAKSAELASKQTDAELTRVRRTTNQLRDDLEEAGIPTTRIFRSMGDCGCGLGPECTIKR